MKKRKQADNMYILQKAKDVLSELLESSDEKVRLKASKLYSASGGGEIESYEKEECLVEVREKLLDSENDNVRLQAVEQVLREIKLSRSDVKSPFEIWYKKEYQRGKISKRVTNHKSPRYKKFKEYWFGKTRYSPHEAQQMVHDSDRRFIVCVTGRRFGKSLMAAKEAEVLLMLPNKRVWIVAPTYALADKVFREIYNELIIKGRVSKDSVLKKSESERIIKLAWGSEVVGKSSDNPDSLLGEAVDMLIFDECAKEKQRTFEKYLRPTLTDRMGRAILITTPEGTNWVYRLYLRGGLAAQSREPNAPPNCKQKQKPNASPVIKEEVNSEWESFLFTTGANPHISGAEIEEAKRTLSKRVFNQEYMAEFFTFSGKIFEDFIYSEHAVDFKNKA
ncbi:terminase large subunit domain-containing protein [Thermodesulfobacteriota bacterium]